MAAGYWLLVTGLWRLAAGSITIVSVLIKEPSTAK